MLELVQNIGQIIQIDNYSWKILGRQHRELKCRDRHMESLDSLEKHALVREKEQERPSV